MERANASVSGKAMSSVDKLSTSGIEKIEENVEDTSSKHLKKARFVWQIKGNYHLKNSSGDSDVNQTSEFSSSEASSSSAQGNTNCDSAPLPTHQSTIKAGLSPAVCDHHPPAARSEPDATSSKASDEAYPPLPPLRIGATSVSCVVCDTFNENIRRASLNIDGEQSAYTPPLPTSHPDWNVRKWQTRQIAMAFMDNTINCLLEDLGFTPLPESAPDSGPDDILGSFNIPPVIDDAEEEEDESVENEGILSAIQRHGLQRHRLQSLPEVAHRYQNSRHSPTRCSPSPPNIWGPSHQLIFNSRNQADGSPSSQESVSIGSEIEMDPEEQTPSTTETEADLCNSSVGDDVELNDNEMNGNYVAPSSCRCAFLNVSKNVKSSHSGSSPTPPSPTGSSDLTSSSDSSDADEMSELDDFGTHSSNQCSSKVINQESESCKKRQSKEKVSSSMSKRKYINPSNNASSSQTKTSPSPDSGLMSLTSNPSDRYSPTFGHFEFMDAAVAAAIQKKGLSALACQDL